MIDKDANPVEWSLLMYELADAGEHLSNLIDQMKNDPKYDQANFSVDLGHVYSHLNRAWHRRELKRDFTEKEWAEASEFPRDLRPT
jgi:hypothetical protein